MHTQINTAALNIFQFMMEKLKGISLPEMSKRRIAWAAARRERYRQRNNSYPYASKRQIGRYGTGLNVYAFQLGPRVPNPLHFTGKRWASL